MILDRSVLVPVTDETLCNDDLYGRQPWVVSSDPAKSDSEGYIVARSSKTDRVKVRFNGNRVAWIDRDRLMIVPLFERVLDCYKCSNESGLYYFGGAVVNGVYTGNTGKCNACAGHGRQTPHDRHRNRVYWNNYRISLAA